jgi:hypothetical protein
MTDINLSTRVVRGKQYSQRSYLSLSDPLLVERDLPQSWKLQFYNVALASLLVNGVIALITYPSVGLRNGSNTPLAV